MARSAMNFREIRAVLFESDVRADRDMDFAFPLFASTSTGISDAAERMKKSSSRVESSRL